MSIHTERKRNITKRLKSARAALTETSRTYASNESDPREIERKSFALEPAEITLDLDDEAIRGPRGANGVLTSGFGGGNLLRVFVLQRDRKGVQHRILGTLPPVDASALQNEVNALRAEVKRVAAERDHEIARVAELDERLRVATRAVETPVPVVRVEVEGEERREPVRVLRVLPSLRWEARPVVQGRRHARDTREVGRGSR